jgi:quercetin 2,3-dioxygenase
MSAGTGVAHSEFNPSDSEAVHLLQIWIMPRARNLAPSYEQKAFSDDDRRNRLRLVASDDGREGSVTIQQDANLYAAILDRDTVIEHSLTDNRYAWLQVARGNVDVNGNRLTPGDGAAISREGSLKIVAADEAELLLFDLA